MNTCLPSRVPHLFDPRSLNNEIVSLKSIALPTFIWKQTLSQTFWLILWRYKTIRKPINLRGEGYSLFVINNAWKILHHTCNSTESVLKRIYMNFSFHFNCRKKKGKWNDLLLKHYVRVVKDLNKTTHITVDEQEIKFWPTMEERKCLALFLLSCNITSAHNKIPVESECHAHSSNSRRMLFVQTWRMKIVTENCSFQLTR